MFLGHTLMMAFQLVDSELQTSRVWWRKDYWGLSNEIVNDPRPMKEIIGVWPNWRDPDIDDVLALNKFLLQHQGQSKDKAVE